MAGCFMFLKSVLIWLQRNCFHLFHLCREICQGHKASNYIRMKTLSYPLFPALILKQAIFFAKEFFRESFKTKLQSILYFLQMSSKLTDYPPSSQQKNRDHFIFSVIHTCFGQARVLHWEIPKDIFFQSSLFGITGKSGFFNCN